MYKLVVVGGKLRGEEYTLAEGENIIGRDSSCSLQISGDGISKKHMRVTVNKDTAFVEDLGSSNGTFVNGKLVKRSSIQNKDKIALPNMIFQVVFVKEKKVIIRKKVAKVSHDDNDDDDEVISDGLNIPQMPDAPLAKVLFIFKYKIMPVIYSFNKEYEWRSMMAILLTIYIIITIFLTIFPVLIDNRKVLLHEVATRGLHYADDIARLNAVFLSRKNLDSLNTDFLEKENGVSSYELFDLGGRIVRPIGKLNEYIQDPFSIDARDKTVESGLPLIKNLGDGEFGIAKAIKAYNVRIGREEPVGVIVIKFAPRSLVIEAANNSKAYLESLTTSFLIGIIFFAIIYFMTIKHFDDLRFQIDQVLRNKQKELAKVFLLSEINPLRSAINSLLQKVNEDKEDGSGEFGEMEDDSKFVNTLYEFLQGGNGPIMVLNSEKLIQHINLEGEDLTGIRESAGSGMALLDVARDQGFAATIIDLCDQCANSNGMCTKGEYELTGKEYEICVNGLSGKDGFVKAFYVTFVKMD